MWIGDTERGVTTTEWAGEFLSSGGEGVSKNAGIGGAIVSLGGFGAGATTTSSSLRESLSAGLSVSTTVRVMYNATGGFDGVSFTGGAERTRGVLWRWVIVAGMLGILGVW